MEIILLEKVRNLGVLGDKVSVKPGYARNHLLPSKKAILATPANLEVFESQRRELEAREQEILAQAQARAEQLTDQVITIDAKAGDEGKLYGSIGTKEIASVISETLNTTVEKSEVRLPEGSLRRIGEYEITLQLHGDVSTIVKVNVVPE